MARARDSENCFRVVEMGVGRGSEVVILGKPQVRDGPNGQHTVVEIGPPDKETQKSVDPQFMFRILKGGTVDNLVKHRQGSLQAYQGFAAMGAMTVLAGEEIIRNSLEVVAVASG
jgi:hypothetical protein